MSLQALLEAVRWAGAKGWTPATGGNFSARLPTGDLVVTASGVDKVQAAPHDLLITDPHGAPREPGRRASAETGLHAKLYALDPAIGAVLHTHTRASTVLSRLTPGDVLEITGFEMQKSLAGNTTHAATIAIAILENDQDMATLAAAVERRWPLQWGLLVRGHGLYAWGADVTEARRHLEGLEFLLDCLLHERLLEP